MKVLEDKDLLELLEIWAEQYKVYAPARQDDNIHMLPFSEEDFTMDYLKPAMPLKEFLLGQKENLFNWSRKEGLIDIKSPDRNLLEKRLYFGIRPCDAYGIAYMDKFYIDEYRDSNYAARRDRAYFVAVNCTEPGENCFCDSLGVGPFGKLGYDLIFTPIGGKYLVEAGSEKGKELIACAEHLLRDASEEEIMQKEKLLEEVKRKFIRKVDLTNIPEIMEGTFNNSIWREISKACIGCTGCTSVCPTCTCFNVVEESYQPGGGNRVRCWDSCQSDSFTRNAGGHNPRNEISRVRYRIYDKMRYIEERFGMKGCTGCGRCIEVCPGLIDITEITARLKEEYDKSSRMANGDTASAGALPGKFETGGREHENNCESIYAPQLAVIKGIIQETKDIKRFIVQYEDKSLHKNYKFLGQFFEVTIFGVGEIAISIPFGPSQRDFFDFCVKKAGKVTAAMHELKVGDRIGLRGPFGKGFPYEEIKGRDLLMIGSGVGIAPIRTMIVRALENKKDFGKIIIIASAQSYEELIYKYDLMAWGVTEGIQVLYAFSRPTEMVEAHVGYINDLLPQLGLNWENTTAIICASPKRIKEVAKDLIQLGMKGKDILTSLETHMRCGIGKCGHCKVGNKYMCVDGPVFNYEEMLMLPPEF